MFLSLLKEIWQGKSLARALMHQAIKDEEIKGLVVDIGGGINPEYWNIFKKDENSVIKSIDLKQTEDSKINLEIDNLPFEDSVADTVLMFNILEHIYNYRHLMKEVNRILKQGGRVIGFVPFLVNYHPDPHDYFRYTKESLRKIFEEVGGKEIEIKEVGRGPFAVNYNNLVLSIPLFLKIMIFPIYYLLDKVFMTLRPKIVSRFPLGYMFVFKK
jgi:SAM-dependent methyltransferase